MIRQELGEEDSESEADQFSRAVEELDAPDAVKERLQKEIRRFRTVAANPSEGTVLRTWLETMLELPWNKKSEDCTDLKFAKQVLDDDHYGLDKVKDRVLEFLAVRHMTSGGESPIICLVGPPGTGKTNTIINTMVTAFFNEKTVLFTSYNNHPIDSVFEKLTTMQYQGKRIPFPVLRLGNAGKVREAIAWIRRLLEEVKDIRVFSSTLDKRRDDRIERAKRLSQLLKKYDEMLEMKERSEVIRRLMEYQNQRQISMEMLPFQADLQGRQLRRVEEKIRKAGNITDEDALALLDADFNQFYQYLYYTSAGYINWSRMSMRN